MREPNFSFPAQNRASVCITSALYDRRALDCTAVLPLINSLTHLVYLTSTSPRIREILTMDGGLERLVRILKTPPTADRRSGWKWALAFQCVVNVGVRGSEQIRTRVVEAGMVPVIITVLDNFLKALEEVKQEKEREQQQRLILQQQQQQQNMTSESTDIDRNHLSVMHLGASRSTPTAGSPGPSFVAPSASTPLTSTSAFAHGSTPASLSPASLAPTPSNSDSTAATPMPIPDPPVTTPFSFFAHLDESNSNSSTTIDYRGPRPATDNLLRTDNGIHNANRNLRVDNATHRIPINGAETASPTHIPGPATPTARATAEAPSPLRTPITPTIPTITPTTTVVPPSPLSRSPSGSNTPIASRSAPTAGITTTTTTPTPPFAPTTSNAALDAILHKEEDILLSLQLLAYLSKYPQLRTTFHTAYPPHNVFQLVEKFTHRLHPPAIHYWAGVIMRNACRKDESRGGVRQCAYLACGRWERYPREFAKCRRCRKAKYCSKQCQSKAWGEGHRWWCVERPHSGAGGGSSGGDGVPSNLTAGTNGGIATPTGDEHHHHHHHHHNGDDGDVDMNMVNLGNARGAALMPLVPPVQVRALIATGVADPMTGDPADNHDLATPTNDLATAAAAVAHLSHRASHHHHHHHRPRSIRAIGGTGRGSEADAASGMIMDMDEEMVAAAANAAASVLIP